MTIVLGTGRPLRADLRLVLVTTRTGNVNSEVAPDVSWAIVNYRMHCVRGLKSVYVNTKGRRAVVTLHDLNRLGRPKLLQVLLQTTSQSFNAAEQLPSRSFHIAIVVFQQLAEELGNRLGDELDHLVRLLLPDLVQASQGR